MQHDKPEYLSDEELQNLIQSIEQEGITHAPQYMKQSILDQIQREENMAAISNHRSSKIQLFTYAMKVGVAAAAAIVLVVLIPVKDSGSLSEEKVSYEQWFNSKYDNEGIKYEEYNKDRNNYSKESKSIYDTTNKL
ncbi:hypothetical protein [Anaerosporobacter sp.]